MRLSSRWARAGVAALGLSAVMVVGSGIAFTQASEPDPAPAAAARGGDVNVPAIATGTGLGSAVSALQERLRRLPGDYSAWASLGTAYVQQARVTGDPTYYGKAQGALERSLEVRTEGNDAALTGLASLAAGRHDFAEALRLAREAQQVNPYSAANQGVMSDALIELGRYDEAFVELQKMVDLRPSVPSLTRVSYAWELRGETERARQELERARDMAVTPADSAYALFYLGELAWNEGDVDAAAEHYAEGLRVDPENVPLLAGMAKVDAARGDVEAAVAGYQRVVQRSPEPSYVVAYADLLAALGRDEEAEQQYAVVAATRQLFEDAGVNVDLELALFDADHGRPEAALEAAESEYGKRRSVHTEDAYAWALHVNGRDREALEHARAATALGTRSALFDYHRGMIEKSLGMTAQAESSLRRALETNPHFSPLLAPRAERALAELGQRR